MKLFFLSFLLIQLSAFACPPCPSGASYSGTGATTSTAGCRCSNTSHTWNGSSCVAPTTCPSGSSTSGTGDTTNVSGCRCTNTAHVFNGTSCVACPSGSSKTGTGATTNVTGCRCTNTSHVFNGSICTAPTVTCPAESKTWTVGGISCTASTTAISSGPQTITDNTGTEQGSATYTCTSGTWSAPSSTSCVATCSPNGAIRSNPSNGTAEVCNSGSWVARTVSTYCLPPATVYFDDDEWMEFHQNLYRAQNSNCDLGQRSNSNGTDLNNPSLGVHSDDAYKPCKNANGCLVNETTPIGGASCPAKTLAWAQGSYTCYHNASGASSGAYIALNDNVASVYGNANARCTAGVWTIYPAYCGSQPVNCTGTYDPYFTIWTCNANGSSVAQCCDPYTTGTCQGYSASCP